MIGIYSRQSIEKKDSISISDQIERCKIEAGKDAQIREYVDPGYSGKDTSRPDFKRMMTDIEKGLLTKIIVYKLDRISRAIVDFGNIMVTLEKHKVEFVSCSEKFDTSTPIGRAMLSIIMVFAQLERETIQQRIIDNYYSRGRQGFYLGGRPPFGFIKIQTSHKGKKTYAYAPHPEDSLLMGRLFERYANTDASLGSLVKELNGIGQLTLSGKQWSSVTLGRLFRNPAFVRADADVYLYLKSKGATMNNDVDDYIGVYGCYVYANRKETTKSKFSDLGKSFVTLGLHEGIVTSDIWIRCQLKLDNNTQLKNTGRGTHSWLTGLMKCEYCSTSVTVVNNCYGHNYLTCSGRKQKYCYERKRPVEVFQVEEIVKKQLLGWIQEKFKDPPSVRDDANKSEANDIMAQIIKIDDEIKKLVDQIPNASDILMKYINKRVGELDAEKASLEKKQVKIRYEKSCDVLSQDDIRDCVSNWDAIDFERKKSIASRIIKSVVIGDANIRAYMK